MLIEDLVDDVIYTYYDIHNNHRVNSGAEIKKEYKYLFNDPGDQQKRDNHIRPVENSLVEGIDVLPHSLDLVATLASTYASDVEFMDTIKSLQATVLRNITNPICWSMTEDGLLKYSIPVFIGPTDKSVLITHTLVNWLTNSFYKDVIIIDNIDSSPLNKVIIFTVPRC